VPDHVDSTQRETLRYPMTFKHALRGLLRHYGFDIVRHELGLPADFDEAAASLIQRVRPYTMTSPERLYALVQAVRYISRAGVPGDVVECGVWRGGSMMAAALTFLECGDQSRDLHLFDTYEGMTPPTEKDVSFDGQTARVALEAAQSPGRDALWCRAGIDDVRTAMHSTGYDTARVHFIAGRVEDTIPAQAPARISLLRLDTDWYESTRHELEHLYGRLSQGGVLIIDDYGHWQGARQAVDEFLSRTGASLLLNRIDYTGRIALKVQ
jgi:O-methyltransferase